MTIDIFQVDAFTNTVFGGNPAAICPLNEWLPDELLQSIASENNLSETAYFVKNGDGFDLRWFTPAYEVDLCGHATLATAHTIYHHLGMAMPVFHFHTRSGLLSVHKQDNGFLMDFPSDVLEMVFEAPKGLIESIGVTPLEILKGKSDFLVIVENQSQIEALKPDFQMLGTVPNCRGLIVSAPGNDVDFVSRCFYPNAGINEDPVTGSAHTTMAPYWAKRLGKDKMEAIQLSARRGYLTCHWKGERVDLLGSAVTFLKGQIYL